MRVAFLVSHFPVVSETFILDQVTGLLDRGCDVQVFADEPAPPGAIHPEYEAYGLRSVTHVNPVPRNIVVRPLRALAMALRTPARIRRPQLRSLNVARYGVRAASFRMFFDTISLPPEEAFDIVHCHFGPNGLRGLALQDIAAVRGRLITSFYGYDLSSFLQGRKNNPYTPLFDRADMILAISDDMRQKLISLGCHPSKVIVHRLGIHPDLFHMDDRPPQSRPVKILSIGRMVPKKGIEYALRAVARVARKSPVEYDIIGDGPLRPRVHQLVGELGLQSIVKLHGWKARPQVIEALKAADLLLAPSVTADDGDEEGTPVVIMEALAAGLPVVATRHAGIPEIVQHEVSGLLVAERNVPQLAEALELLIADAGLRCAMGQRGRRAVEAQHNIAELNDRLLALYRHLTDYSSGGR